MTTATRILVLASGVIVAAGAYAYLTCFAPSPRITKAEIERSGAKSLSTPSGRLLEYFEFGASKSDATATLLLLHGAMTTGALWQTHDEWAKRRKVRIISPSLPGWGLSEHKGIDSMTQPQEFVLDVVHLMSTVEISRFHVAGASLGSVYAAQIAASTHTSAMVGNVMLYVPMAPASDTHDPLAGV
jgi:pimeloyl-ACP methyl ester carboxylesterase